MKQPYPWQLHWQMTDAQLQKAIRAARKRWKETLWRICRQTTAVPKGQKEVSLNGAPHWARPDPTKLRLFPHADESPSEHRQYLEDLETQRPHQQAIKWLRRRHYSHAEIAEQLGIPKTAVALAVKIMRKSGKLS